MKIEKKKAVQNKKTFYLKILLFIDRKFCHS